MNSKKKVLSLLFLIFCISCSSTSKVENTAKIHQEKISELGLETYLNEN